MAKFTLKYRNYGDGHSRAYRHIKTRELWSTSNVDVAKRMRARLEQSFNIVEIMAE